MIAAIGPSRSDASDDSSPFDESGAGSKERRPQLDSLLRKCRKRPADAVACCYGRFHHGDLDILIRGGTGAHAGQGGAADLQKPRNSVESRRQPCAQEELNI
jgi:hypothetical protein